MSTDERLLRCGGRPRKIYAIRRDVQLLSEVLNETILCSNLEGLLFCLDEIFFLLENSRVSTSLRQIEWFLETVAEVKVLPQRVLQLHRRK